VTRYSPFIAAIAGLAAGAAAAQDACGPLARLELEHTSIASAANIAGDGGTRAPGYCEVHATITPVPGSKIGAVYRLPASWNGKVLGLGGGGFAGNVRAEAAADGLARGYAVIQNDLGHASASALDPSFAIDDAGRRNVEGIVDFGHRATHLATVIGKQVAARFYGREPERAYWQGCSTGGRQGLAEVQRYPDDYDGVIAGAPVYTPVTYANAMLRVQMFHALPKSNLEPEHVPLIRDAVLAACDDDDGVADGILTDPRTCAWDPAELQCAASEAHGAACLSPAQVETARRAYSGVRMQDGRYAAMPLMRGGESDWVARMIGTPTQPRGVNALLGAPFMAYIAVGDPKYDFMTFEPERLRVLDGGIAAAEVHQQNPNIAPFVRAGGKLLLWHGFNDPGPSPLSTIAYYEAVLDAVPAARDNVRLFLAPGVLHCAGGSGPDRFDALTALENWVERGVAPASLLATKQGSPLSRPLCPYPALPRYKERAILTTLRASNASLNEVTVPVVVTVRRVPRCLSANSI
jgi:feruloyl esterase